MSGGKIDVGMRITGDAKGARDAILATEKDLATLAASGRKIVLLEGADVRAKELSSEIEAARQKVDALAEAYSEAFAAGADNKQLKELAGELSRAEREAERLGKAFDANARSVSVLQRELKAAGVDVARIGAERLRIEQTARAISSVQGAFSLLNIRPAAKIEAEINAINIALRELASRANVSGDEFDRAFASAQLRVAKLRAELKGTPEEIAQVGRKADGLLGSLKALGGAYAGVELARQFVMVNVELENIERSFIAVTGSVDAASAEMDYARDVANKLGLEQISTTKAYAGLIAATKGTAAEGESSRRVFESVSRAMSLAGKSAADTDGALNALQQMASKGVVSMEELRGQLGERLPGALNAAAEGFGITTAQLIKLTESGQLTAEELFPALASGLDKLYQGGGAETLTQEWNHFTTALQDAAVTVGEAGAVNDVFKTSLEALSAYISIVAVGFVALGEKIGVFLGALLNGEIGINGFSDTAKQAFADIEQSAQDKLLKSAGHNRTLAAMMGEAGEAAQKSAREQTAAATGAQKGWTQLNVAFGAVTESSAAATKQAIATAAAKKAEAGAAVSLAAALGAEVDQVNAKANAAAVEAAQAAIVAERRAEELAVVERHILLLQEEAAANGGATEQQTQVINGFVMAAEARKADADAAAAQAAQSAAVAVQTAGEAAAYAAARTEAASFGAVKQGQMSVDQASIRLAIEQERTTYEVAKAKGNEGAATAALIRMKRLEADLAEVVAKAKQAEAKATLLGVQAQRAALEAAGDLTDAKRAEFDALEAGAKVKEIEGKISEETARRTRQLADAFAQSGGAAAGAAGHIAGIGNAAAESVGGVNSLTQALRGLKSAQSAAGEGGGNGSVLDDPDVRSRSGAVPVAQALYREGASLQEAELAKKYYGEISERNASISLGGGNITNTEQYTRAVNRVLKQSIQQALEMARREISTGEAVDMGASVKDITKQQMAVNTIRNSRDERRAVARAGREAAGQVQTKTIRLELDAGAGRKSTIYTDSEGDAARLIKTLKAAGLRARK